MTPERGDIVVVYAPAFYRERRVGVIVGPCKDHDGAFRISLLNETAPIIDVCADPNNGDEIVILNPNPPS